MVRWKKYNFFAPPCTSTKIILSIEVKWWVQAQTDNHDVPDFITARAMISRYMLSSCSCHKCDISTFWKISRYFPTREIHLPAKEGLLSGCWFQQREMQYLICFNSVSGPRIALRSGRWPNITATLICSGVLAAKLSYKHMLLLGADSWNIGSYRWCVCPFCQCSVKTAKRIITQVKLLGRHRPRTDRIKLW